MPSIDKDATTTGAHASMTHAQGIRQQADADRDAVTQAVSQLGDLYADFKDAMLHPTQGLIAAKHNAHYRLAGSYDGLGEKDLNTVNMFTLEDEDRAARIGQVTGEGTPPTQMV
jgi:hypothetical protein